MSILQTRSRKMAATQAQLNSRVGGTATAAPATTPLSGGWFAGYSKNIPTILLVVAGVVVVFIGVYNPTWSNPHPTTMGSWGRGHWLTLLMLWGIGAALVALNACGAVAKTLQWVLAGAVLVLLVGFPAVGWFSGLGGDGRRQTRAQARAEQPTLTLPAGVGSRSPRIPVPLMKKVVMTGGGFRYHCVYRNGNEESFIPEKEPPCRDGDLPFVYATNLKEEENVVAYAYANP